jgi:nicotinamidase-related amidase
MSAAKPTALLVIDVQESFRHRPGFDPGALPGFLAAQNALIEGARERGLPIVRVFHVADEGVFAPESGCVVPMAGLAEYQPALEVRKRRHSALAGTDLGAWLTEHGITRVIISGMRTEQCCETTARAASDAGFEVVFVTGATLTFAMRHANGRTYTPEEIRERTELVLAGRFATISSVAEAFQSGS